MHVTQIELLNFKAIKNYKSSFTGGIYLVTGENEIGKSTLLSAITMLLTGDRTDNLLTKGANDGYVKATIGDYKVELKFSEKNPRGTLSIIQTSTNIKSDRISALQGIFNFTDFDANDFVRWSETAEGRRKQIGLVRSLIPKDVLVELDTLEKSIQQNEIVRREKGIEVRMYDVVVKTSELQSDICEMYAKPIDPIAVMDEKAKAEALNLRIEKANQYLTTKKAEHEKFDKSVVDAADEKFRVELQFYTAEIKAHEEKILQHKQKIMNLEKQKADWLKSCAVDKLAIKAEIEKTLQWLSTNPTTDLSTFAQKLEAIKAHNEMNRKVEEYMKNLMAFQTATHTYQELTDKIETERKRKEMLVKSNPLPISGLTFNDDGLLLNGIPFKNGDVSTSQEMEVAAKLMIALNPNVKVFKIAQGESLGEARLKAIIEFAKTNGYQGFIEEVKRGQNELEVHEYTEGGEDAVQ